MKQIFLTENQIKYIKESMLLEGSRDNMLLPYLEMVQKNDPSVTMSQLKNFLMKKFVTEANIHSLSLGSNFYLCGVARYYFNGDLTLNKKLNIFNPNIKDKFDTEICHELDEIIVYLRNLYIDTTGTKFEQPEDFGTLTIQQLIRKYYGKVQKLNTVKVKDDDTENPYKDVSNKVSNKYTYDIMYSQEDCKKYNEATSPGAWCITYAQQHYNFYVKKNSSHFVIFLQNGYENIARKPEKNFPLDKYGLSMLAVQQSNVDGSFIGCTTRWNHGAGDSPSVNNADNALTYEQFKNVTKISDEQFKQIFDIWKYNKPKRTSVDRSQINKDKTSAIRNFKYAQMLLRNGATLEKLRDDNIITNIKTFDNSPLNEDINNKIAMKSVIAIETIVNDTNYWTIMDRGNVLVDEILALNIKTLEYDVDTSYSVRNNQSISKRFIVCICKSGNIYYDTKKHNIVIVDDNKMFKCINACNNEIIIMRDTHAQVCAYFYNLMKPLVLPNEQYYADEISINTGNNNVIYIVYDKSAGTTFFYNLLKNEFIDKLNNYKLFTSYMNSDSYGEDKIRVNSLDYNEDYYTNKLFDISKNEFIELDGTTNFRHLSSYYNGKYMFDGVNVYFTDTLEKLMIPYVGKLSLKRVFCNDNIMIIGLNETKKDVLYNMKYNKFYINEDGTYLFNYYGSGRVYNKYGKIVDLPENPDGEYWYTGKNLIDLGDVQKLLDEGRKPEDIFSTIELIDNNDDRFEKVELNGVYNVYRKDTNSIISNKWFYGIYKFSDGFAIVMTDSSEYGYNKYNYLKKDGTLLLKESVNECQPFNSKNGLAIIANYSGKILIDENGDKIKNLTHGFYNIKSTTSPYYYLVLETSRHKIWKYLSVNGNIFSNANDAIKDSEQSMIDRNNNYEKIVSENVDFYKKHKFKMSGENISDYAHIVDEEFDKIVNEYTEDKNNNNIFLTKGDINELCEDNELKDVINSFDLQKTLNGKFWINNKLNSRIRLRLLDIADKFIESLDVNWVKPKDIIMTGSLANYNWSKYSDIDLHIVIDFEDVDERVDFVKNYFDSKKKLWNEEHEDLTIYGYPIEVYVQDVNEEHKSSGIYSLEKNKWIVEPEKDELKATKLNKKAITNKVLEIINKIDDLENKINSEKDIEKLDILSNKVKTLFDRIKNYRKESLKHGTEMATGNIIFKCLRRTGHIGKLVDLKSKTFDKINSIK